MNIPTGCFFRDLAGKLQVWHRSLGIQTMKRCGHLALLSKIPRSEIEIPTQLKTIKKHLQLTADPWFGSLDPHLLSACHPIHPSSFLFYTFTLRQTLRHKTGIFSSFKQSPILWDPLPPPPPPPPCKQSVVLPNREFN